MDQDWEAVSHPCLGQVSVVCSRLTTDHAHRAWVDPHIDGHGQQRDQGQGRVESMGNAA